MKNNFSFCDLVIRSKTNIYQFIVLNINTFAYKTQNIKNCWSTLFFEASIIINKKIIIIIVQFHTIISLKMQILCFILTIRYFY